MDFTEKEVQQIINATLCLGEHVQYVQGKDLVEKSKSLTKIAIDIKKKNGTVDRADINIAVIR